MGGYENRDMFRNSLIQKFNTYEKASLEREAAVPINLLIAYVYRQDLMLFECHQPINFMFPIFSPSS